MRYLILASDYDGTLASQGVVDRETVAAIDLLLKSGRKFVLVTGRELDDLKTVFPQIDRCALVVAENGGLLYNPATQDERSLTEPPNPEFLAELTRRQVPFSVGRGIVATWEPHQTTVLDVIHSLGLELQLSFNKGAVMVLLHTVWISNDNDFLETVPDSQGKSDPNPNQFFVVGFTDSDLGGSRLVPQAIQPLF